MVNRRSGQEAIRFNDKEILSVIPLHLIFIALMRKENVGYKIIEWE